MTEAADLVCICWKRSSRVGLWGGGRLEVARTPRDLPSGKKQNLTWKYQDMTMRCVPWSKTKSYPPNWLFWTSVESYSKYQWEKKAINPEQFGWGFLWKSHFCIYSAFCVRSQPNPLCVAKRDYNWFFMIFICFTRVASWALILRINSAKFLQLRKTMTFAMVPGLRMNLPQCVCIRDFYINISTRVLLLSLKCENFSETGLGRLANSTKELWRLLNDGEVKFWARHTSPRQNSLSLKVISPESFLFILTIIQGGLILDFGWYSSTRSKHLLGLCNVPGFVHSLFCKLVFWSLCVQGQVLLNVFGPWYSSCGPVCRVDFDDGNF